MTKQKLEIEEIIDREDALFHYTKLSTALELILLAGRLKLSLLKDAKDPAEYKDKFLALKGNNVSSEDECHFQEFNRIVNNTSDKCRVLSFCSNKEPTLIGTTNGGEHGCSKGWERSRMWSQYAEGHTGICLVFSKEKWEENLKKELGTKQPPIKYKTGYTEYYQYRTAYDECLSAKTLSNGNLEEHAINYIEKNLYLKLIDYRDEAEYRTVIFNREVEYLDINSSITGVIVGDKTSCIYDSPIKELCDTLRVKPLRVHWDGRKLVPLPLR